MYKKKPAAMASKTTKTTGPSARPVGGGMKPRATGTRTKAAGARPQVKAAGARPQGKAAGASPTRVGKSRAAGGLKGVANRKKPGRSR